MLNKRFFGFEDRLTNIPSRHQCGAVRHENDRQALRISSEGDGSMHLIMESVPGEDGKDSELMIMPMWICFFKLFLTTDADVSPACMTFSVAESRSIIMGACTDTSRHAAEPVWPPAVSLYNATSLNLPIDEHSIGYSNETLHLLRPSDGRRAYHCRHYWRFPSLSLRFVCVFIVCSAATINIGEVGDWYLSSASCRTS